MDKDCYALSPMQEGMLFHTLRTPDLGVDICQVMVDLAEDIDPIRFEEAWQQLVERHAILRTSFQWENLNGPRQLVHEEIRIPITHRDWSGLEAGEQSARFVALLEEERRQRFELAVAPLMRVVLIKSIGPSRFRFIWTYHHILLDARSLTLLLKEFFALYEGLCKGSCQRYKTRHPTGIILHGWSSRIGGKLNRSGGSTSTASTCPRPSLPQLLVRENQKTCRVLSGKAKLKLGKS